MDSRWRIELLGGLRTLQPGRSITRFRTHKTGLLLAYLALHRDRSHSREHVIELLWPDMTPQAGRNQLSMALSFLRHPLEPPGVPAGAVLIADRTSVRLNPESIATDVADFEAALRNATVLSGDAERVAALRAAVELYRGALLPGYYEDWVLGERARLREGYGQALQQLTHLYERNGDLARAVETAGRAARHDPHSEETLSDLMRLYQVTGQPEVARRAWRDFEQRLLDELGETPSPVLRTLAAGLQIDAEETEADEASEAPRWAVETVGARKDGPVPKPTPGTKPPIAAHTFQNPARSEQSWPTGTVALLLTDIEGSTAQWQHSGVANRSALALHHMLLRQQFERYDGHEIKEMGGGFLVAFARPSEALHCAIAAQRVLAEQPWPKEADAVQVCMALHVGEAEAHEGDYRGLALHHASRLLAAAHGGQILCSEPAAVLLRSDLEVETWLEDVGLYRLRDLSGPQRLFQVSYAGMANRDFGAQRADRAHSATLPLQLTRFVGREAEISHLRRLLLPDVKPTLSRSSASPPLVTVTGPGGVGKTRLTLEVAGQLVEPLSGAVFFAGLAEVRDATRLADTLVDALKLARSPQREPLDQVIEFLGRQACVLVLDNFEQLLDEESRARESVGVVSTLLERVASLRVLVTSRQRLGLSGEREFRVAPLKLPPGGEEAGGLTPDRLASVESVALFVDRAQVARPDFQLTARNTHAVGELCASLEGIPLAIELAAARAQVLTPSQMLRQLKGRFKFLVGRGRGMQERHRTLEAAIDWGYRLLQPDLQRLFIELSVFRGGWTLEGAEAVCAETGDVLDALEYLHRSSLIDSEENGRGGMRFRMLETIREYAAEKLEWSGETAALGRRHGEYFLALAEEAESKLTGADQGEWLERLEEEHENLRVALERSLNSEERGTGEWRQPHEQQTPQASSASRVEGRALGEEGREEMHPSAVAGLRFCGALQRFWETRGYLSEGREWCERALGKAGGQERTPERAKALNTAGGLANSQGDGASARACYEESLTLFREIGDRSGVGTSLGNLGVVAWMQGDYASARAYFEESVTIRREVGDRSGIANSLHSLGSVARMQGDYASAQANYEESLTLFREIGDRKGIAYSLHDLGSVAYSQGDYASARAYLEESLTIRREIGDRWGIANSLDSLGNVAYFQGEYASAHAYFEESLPILREIGDRRGIANSLHSLGNAALSQGDYASARAYYEESLTILREIGDQGGIAYSLHSLGSVAYFQGEYASARAYNEESLAINRESGDRRGIIASLRNLGSVARGQGDYASARAYYKESLTIARAIGDRRGMLKTLGGLAGLAAVGGDLERGVRLWGAAEALREGIGMPSPPNERAAYERDTSAAREAMGAEAFEAAWSLGSEMSEEQAAAYALAEASA